MSFLSRFGWSPWSLSNVEPPWGARPSIYDHVRAHLRDDAAGLAPGGDELPDEARIRGGSQFGWAPGALDGAFGHHGSPGTVEQAVEQIFDALGALTESATDERVTALYALLTSHSVMEDVDPLLQRIVDDGSLDAERLHAVAHWLASSAPDREPVKLAIALLGVVHGENDRDLLLSLGRHEEFTLYSAVALRNQEPNGERTIFDLARKVDGWGRVHLVERLADTQDDEIRAWMLREGYRNSVLWEYTALVCARTGGLAEALRLPHPDDALLRGAGDLLATLTGSGGPAEGMESYPDGAEATERWLGHLRDHVDLDLQHFLNVHRIRRFLQEEEFQGSEVAADWLERRERLLGHISAIVGRPEWADKARSQLDATDREAFWTAAEAAKVLGIDPWEHYFQRTERGEDFWWQLMQTDDPARIDRVVAFAEARLPLDKIASGPGDALGMGPEFQHHGALDFVLQDLRRFPGKGWALIRAGLRSPVIRNRNMALNALGAWPRESWPDDAELLVRRVVAEEPNDRTAALGRRVLAGEPLE